MTSNVAEKPITSDMTIGKIVEKYPQTTDVLLGYGLHCVGCAVNPYETLEQGALGHGMNKETIESLLNEVNMVVTKKAPYPMNPDGITLSPNAVDTIEAMMETENKIGFGLKVNATAQKGGLDYFLDIVAEKGKDEKELEWEGIKIFVDQKSLDLINPSVIDYLNNPGAEGFKIIPLGEEPRCKCDKPLSECGCADGECKSEKDTCCGGDC